MEEDRRKNNLHAKAAAILARNASSFEFNKFKEMSAGQIGLLDRMADLTNSLLIILEPGSGQFLYVSSNSEPIIGYPAKAIREGGFRKYLTLLHPEEIEALVTFQDMGMGIFNMAHQENRMDFRLVVDQRMRCKAGQYQKFMRTSIPLEVDGQGKVLAWLNSYRDVTHLKREDSICLIVRESEQFTRIYKFSVGGKEIERVQPFTRREKEVLAALSQGQTTSEIADGLSITRASVDAHRRKIVAKTAACNPESVITYLNLAGMLNGRALF